MHYLVSEEINQMIYERNGALFKPKLEDGNQEQPLKAPETVLTVLGLLVVQVSSFV